jgi:hypothetical protein
LKGTTQCIAEPPLAVYQLTVLAAVALGLAQVPVNAQEAVTLRTSIKDHRFQPSELKAPANRPITLAVRNLDPTPEEFESRTLRVEKVIAGNSEIAIQLRPKSGMAFWRLIALSRRASSRKRSDRNKRNRIFHSHQSRLNVSVQR